LVLDPATVLTPGLPRNPLAVGTPLENILRNGGTLPGGLQTLPNLSGADLANTLTLLSGEAATGAQHSAFQMMKGFLGLFSDPFAEGRGGSGVLGYAAADPAWPAEVASAYAAVLKTGPSRTASLDQRWGVWGGAYGGGSRFGGDAVVVGSHDLSARAAGVAAGADYRLTPSTTVGFALAGGNGHWSLAQGLGGGRNDAFQAGVYARTNTGPAYLSAAFAAAEHWLSTSRTALAGSQLSASFSAQSYGGRIEAGYRLAGPVVAVTPYAAVQALAFTTPGYGETDGSGAGLGLNYAGRTASDTLARWVRVSTGWSR
jgi:uncharacterized protein with beta-barrel porin domain